MLRDSVVVVVDEFLDAGLYYLDFGEDLFGGGGPAKGLGVGVPGVDEIAYASDQVVDRGEGAAPNGLAGQDSKPDLDLVQP